MSDFLDLEPKSVELKNDPVKILRDLDLKCRQEGPSTVLR